MNAELAVVIAPFLAVILLWLPGLLPLIAGGIRPGVAAAVAPAVTLGITAAVTLLLPHSIPWNGLVLVAASILLTAVIVLWRGWRSARAGSAPKVSLVARLRPAEASRPSIVVLVVGVVATGIAIAVYIHVSRGLAVVPQDFDHVFQANAVRYIADSGDPSPQGLREINDYSSSGAFYYPSAWHAVAALVLPLVGGNTLAVVHSMVIAMLVALPLGSAALARAMGLRTAGVVAAVAVSSAFANLPWEMLWRGLLPFTMSLVLVVPVVVLAREGALRRTLPSMLLLALAVLGLVSVHTSAAVTILVMGVPTLIVVLVEARGRRMQVLVWLAGAVVLVGAALVPMVAALSEVLGEAEVAWPSELRIREGVLHAFTFTGVYREASWLNLGWFVVAGMVVAVVRRKWLAIAVTVSTLAAMGLFVLTASVELPWARALTQFWWDDPLRTAAMSTLAAPALVGVAFDWVAPVRRDELGESSRRRPLRVIAAVLAFAVLAWAGWTSLWNGERYVAFKYTDGPTVTDGEREAYAFLGQIDPDGRVMNDPGDGSAWMYALEGVRPVFGHFSIPGNSRDAELFWGAFDDFETRDDVEAVIEKYDVDYVVIGSGMVFPWIESAPGLDQVDERPELFREIFRNEDAAVYEVLRD